MKLLLDLSSYEDCAMTDLNNTTLSLMNQTTEVIDSVDQDLLVLPQSTSSVSSSDLSNSNMSWERRSIYDDISKMQQFKSTHYSLENSRRLNITLGIEDNPCHEGPTTHFPDVSIKSIFFIHTLLFIKHGNIIGPIRLGNLLIFVIMKL